jgi:hypothetical protein
MIEPLRSQYLVALGIENYVPRFVLPGAKLSEPCDWLDAPSEVIGREIPAEENIAVDQNQRENQPRGEIQRPSLINVDAKRPHRSNENSIPAAPKIVAAHNAGPQFALSVVLASGGILLIDDAPASNAERNAFQTLLKNMLPALRPQAAQYILDSFIWPLSRQPKIPRDADAAKETLAAYLNKQIKQRSIDIVLLLGEAAQQWCVVEDDIRIVKSTSLLACAKDPALKRTLWNDIRHLAER